ncbi:sec-independent protein translocase protein TATA, chloroplastic [Ziziphus jujuba]|uniref:Sec-independent protein translocase protein TATA, chloroplastic n=1 Tax=Ziziphus jujuba TaxID=326968 RepID=A0A6P3ZAN5_ZIZJJ|nr:sec-independent protein translocase protein TATA, chloroplastic [Ziziphus jujuba]
MEISSITLSIPRPPPYLPLSSSQSSFLTNNVTCTSLLNRNKAINGAFQIRTRPRTQRAKKGFTCNALFGLGVPELVVIAGVAALVFGPKKLPEVGKSIGKTVKSFQQAAKEFESELKKEPDSIEPPVDKPTAVSEEEKQDVKVSSSKESV